MQGEFICESGSCPQGNLFHKNATLVVLPDGDLLAAWMAHPHGEAHRFGGEGHRETKTYASRLPAGDSNWTDPACIVDVHRRPVGSPVLFVGPNDELWLAVPVMYGDWLSGSRLMFKRSLDDGATWGDLEILHEKPGLYLKNKPLYLEREDRWVLGTDTYQVDAKPHFLLISDDHVERLGDFPPLVGGDQIVPPDPDGYVHPFSTENFIYPTAVELSDGKLLAYLRPRSGGHLWETRSRDRGLNWTRAEETAIPNPNAGFDVHRLESGNLLLIDNPTTGERPTEDRNVLALFMSEDDGETWPYQLYLEREEVDEDLGEIEHGERPSFSYGNIVQADDGTIHLAYEVRRRGIKHVETTRREIEAAGSDTVVVDDLL